MYIFLTADVGAHIKGLESAGHSNHVHLQRIHFDSMDQRTVAVIIILAVGHPGS